MEAINKTQTQTHSIKPDFSGQDIYIGIDVHKKSWTVSIYLREFEHKTYTTVPDAGKLYNYLKKQFPNGRYHSVYEAGYSGYWIDKQLRIMGIDNKIVNPADVPTNNKEKVRKTDPVDSRKLAQTLRNQQVKGIYVPDDEILSGRLLVRERRQVVKKITRCKNQIKSRLSFLGIKIDEDEVKRHWSRLYINKLDAISQTDDMIGRPMSMLLKELEMLREINLTLTKEIRSLSKTQRYREQAENLTTIPGISNLSAMIILTEIIDIKRFSNFGKLCSYVGLIPDEHSSGERRIITGITNRRNPYLRHILTEISWVAVRKDPALGLCFTNYAKRMPKGKAIVKIARKVLNRIRYVMINKKQYVTGVLE